MDMRAYQAAYHFTYMFISVHLIGTCSSSSPVGVQAKMPQGRLNYNRNINVQSIQKAFVSFKKISTKI